MKAKTKRTELSAGKMEPILNFLRGNGYEEKVDNETGKSVWAKSIMPNPILKLLLDDSFHVIYLEQFNNTLVVEEWLMYQGLLIAPTKVSVDGIRGIKGMIENHHLKEYRHFLDGLRM